MTAHVQVTHDCTSSVWDELVHIQLLNLVQSQRLSQTFFFLPVDLPCSPKYPVQKNIATYPTPLPTLQFSFFKTLFLFTIIGTIYRNNAIIGVQRKTRNCCNFKV